MCGRFSLYSSPDRLARYFDAVLDDELDPEGQASYNVAPTDPVLGLRAVDGDGHRQLAGFRWGLITPGSPSAAGAARLVNARAETLTSRPSFRDAFEHRRLVVPADGFYEWRTSAAGAKQPYYFHRVDGAPLCFAGLWAEWQPPGTSDPGARVRSCTIVTTDAGDDMDGIHDRMPVVLAPDTLDVWLEPGAEHDELDGLLHPAPAGTLAHHAVDRRVGNVRFNDAELIAEARPAEEPTQLSLLTDDSGR
jgi:putative SOS response-associated peptidase YedK